MWSLASAPPHRVESLLDLLSGDADPDVRQAAMSMMMQLGLYELAEARLLADLESGMSSYGATEQLLMKLGTPSAIDAVMQRIEGGTRKEWDQAIRAVAAAGRQEHVAQLLDLSDRTPNPELQQAILQALIFTDTVDVDAVVDRALATDDPSLQGTAAMALARSGTERSRTLLRELARSEHPMVAASALNSLGQLGGPDAEAALSEALQSPDIAWSAVQGLQSLGTPSARATLRDAATQSSDPTVRSAVLQQLPNLGLDDTHDILERALEADDDLVQYAAVNALSRVGTTQAAETLATALRSGTLSEEGAAMTARALQQLGGDVAEAHADWIDDALPTVMAPDTGIPSEFLPSLP